MMASQKVRPTALRRFFRTSAYLMYAFAPEKPPSLVGRNFYLAILLSFCDTIKNIFVLNRHPDRARKGTE
jgi:hypothetical protein